MSNLIKTDKVKGKLHNTYFEDFEECNLQCCDCHGNFCC